MNRGAENNEWLDEYTSLKQVDQSNPFMVPDGYFAAMEQQVTSFINISGRVSTENNEGFVVPENYFEALPGNIQNSIAVTSFNAADGFSVPEGYFDELSTNIQSRVALAAITAVDGFTVPENYFEQLSDAIQSRAKIEEYISAEKNQFTVPENYFEELSSNIQSRIRLEEIVSAEANSFVVPENYFDELNSNIQSRINVEGAMAAAAESFLVPENYFEELSGNIQSRIAFEELLTEEPFSVPAGYFDELQAKIVQKTTADTLEKISGKIVQFERKGIVRRLVTSAAFKYATAACFAVAIGTGIFINQISTTTTTAHNRSFLHQTLSDVPLSDIQSYLQLHVDATDTHGLATDDSHVNSDNLNNDLQDYLDSNQ